jgi:hypothetical protein
VFGFRFSILMAALNEIHSRSLSAEVVSFVRKEYDLTSHTSPFKNELLNILNNVDKYEPQQERSVRSLAQFAKMHRSHVSKFKELLNLTKSQKIMIYAKPCLRST